MASSELPDPSRFSTDDVIATTVQLFCTLDESGQINPDWNASHVDAGRFQPGELIGQRYRLQSKLGEGGMGMVFLAIDQRLQRRVALKIVRGPRADLPAAQHDLWEEARVVANLNHPAIAAVYDFGMVDRFAYAIFEFVEGKTLRQLLQLRRQFTLSEAIPIIEELAEALDCAHAARVIHRDLKPENVCATIGGHFKVLDFGLADALPGGSAPANFAGTPAYASPEQATGRPLDGRSDQYALALIAFEMLAGRRVFVDQTVKEVLDQHVHVSPPALSQFVEGLPAAVDKSIQRAMSKNPEQRFATCQEFAKALGAGSAPTGSRHLISTPANERRAFYISHAASETLLAKQLTAAIEANRWRCWFYGRDAVPGIAYDGQTKNAMTRAAATLYLISHATLGDAEVEQEIEYAAQMQVPMLPILVDISREEFEQTVPRWRRWFGGATVIEYRRGQSLDTLTQRIAAAASMLEIPIDPTLNAVPRSPRERVGGQVWATDAFQIGAEDLQRVLFHTEQIDDYLSLKQRFFVSASKGLGKTLLLTCKRHLLTAGTLENQSSIQLIPEGRPFLDFMSELRVLSKHYDALLADLAVVKRLWGAALRIAAISHHARILETADEPELRTYPERIAGWLRRGGKIQPTVVFKELLSLRVSELNRCLDRGENFLDQKARMIHQGTAIFIDKVDQAIHHLSRDAWIAIQAGLLEAAWELMNANSHINVYASIRAEAFNNYHSDTKSNLFAATTSLEYSAEELRALLDRLAQCYEGCESFSDFLGANVVRHGRRPIPEDSFRYVLRHTCSRPRDLVAIASEISSKRSGLSDSRFRSIVQRTSSTVVVSNVFDEVRVFLDCLMEPDARSRFLGMLPANILSYEQALRVCEQFNGLEIDTLRFFGDDSLEILHPFRDLYFTGLLGHVEEESEYGRKYQRFRQPHDRLTQQGMELPRSGYYLLHPALSNFISEQRARKPYRHYQYIPLGDGLPWEDYYEYVIELERVLVLVADVNLKEAAHRLIARVQAVLNGGRDPAARALIESSVDWSCVQTHRANEENEEELKILMEELVKKIPS